MMALYNCSEVDMFDATQYATLRALVDRMIPADDMPGGLDAGVDRYILHLLQHDGAGFASQYLTALDALQQEAVAQYGCAFAQLRAVDADALLHGLTHHAPHTRWQTSPPAFIALLAEHCAEGFYADPRQGGNADQVSWRMIGFEERR